MSSEPHKVMDWFRKCFLPARTVGNKILGWGRRQYKYFLRSFLLMQTFRTCRYTGIPLTREMINKGTPNINLNHEDMKNPNSLNVGEIMITINRVAVGIGERLSFETQKLIDQKMDELQERAINRLEKGDPNWEITEEEFRQVFNFELEFVRDNVRSPRENRKLLLDYLGIIENKNRKLTLADIWENFEYEIKGIEYDFESKIAKLNKKIEQFVNDKEQSNAAVAYENLLSDTELANPSKMRAGRQMIDFLYVLVGSGYIGSNDLGKMIDPHHWGKIQLFWNLDDTDYPSNP